MKNTGIFCIIITIFLFVGCAKKASDQVKLAKDVEQNIIAKEVRTETVTGMKFRKIPRKSIWFRIGSPPTELGRQGNEKQHTLRVEKFWMAETEVTQGQWKMIMGSNPSKFKGDDLPVDSISWNEAQKFIQKLNARTGKEFRLPTEVEWELAARAGTTTARYWGEDIGFNNANCYRCGQRWDGRETAPVRSFAPNNFGLYDMLGNVWEWTCSEYKEKYDGVEQKCSTGAQSYTLRGGALNNSAKWVRAAARARDRPEGSLRGYNCGFRLAMDSSK
jgi:formylglycine-generating enzyme required for sulfatase activity